ncbi:outer membrane beta-barrel protein [Sphingomonas sp. FW199]|uniref:outer membrane beta-barrel protein n=1 Tax=Sphingomonas sp. FW199 TaxID=3400217 RepID=UPI003CE9AAA7
MKRFGANTWRCAAITMMSGIAITGGAGTAMAQTLSAEGSTFGGFQREVDVGVAVDAIYSGNTTRGRSETATARGLVQSDFLLNPKIEGNVRLPVGPVQLAVSGDIGYQLYARNTQLNRERISLTANAGTAIGPCGLMLNGNYSRAQTDQRDLAIVPGDTEASSVNVNENRGIGVVATCGAAVGIRAVGLASYATSENNSVRRQISNANTFTYGGGLQYSAPAVGQVTTFVSKTEVEFPDRIDLGIPGFGADRFDLFAAGVRLDRRLGARLQFNGQVSYAEVTVEGLTDSQYDGIIWDAALSLRATPKLNFSVGTGKTVGPAGGFSANFVETSTVRFGTTYALTERLLMRLNANYQQRDFDLQTVTAPDRLSNDEFGEIGLGFNFNQSLRLLFRAYVGYEKRNAELDIYDYDAFSASLGVRLRL